MKKFSCFSLIYFVLFLNKTLGCSCIPLNEIKTKDDLEEYDFVALVKIKKLKDSSDKNALVLSDTYLANITILELFKGNYVKQKASFLGRDTDCDIGVYENEMWIIFGKHEGNFISISFCSHSTRYILSEDWEDKLDKTPELLYTLRSLYNPLPNKQQLSSFWEMIQGISKDIYTETKLFLYQTFILLKSIFHGFYPS
jgi:hypothetical protein